MIEPTLFAFIDELAEEIRTGRIHHWDRVDTGAGIMVFFEAFFDQFFASIGQDIAGFDISSKEEAAQLAEKLAREDPSANGLATRGLIVAYEEMCDLYDDLTGGYGGGRPRFRDLHDDHLLDFFDLVIDWTKSANAPVELAEQVSRSKTNYEDAVRESGWLTKKQPVLKRKLFGRGRK